MIIYYEFNDDDFEYEPPQELLEEIEKKILQSQNQEDLIEIIMAGDNIEDCFYDELKDYFEQYAWAEYKQEIANSEPPYRQSDFI